MQDVLYALRLYARHRAAVATAIVSLALSLGLSVAILAVFNAWLFPNLGVSDAPSLKWVVRARDQQNDRPSQGGWSYRDFLTLRRALPETPLAAIVYSVRDLRVGEARTRDSVATAFVSGDFFQVVGTRAAFGRLLTRDDDIGNNRVVVLSHGAWARLFGRDTSVIGESLSVNGRTYQIVGVTSPDFHGPSPTIATALWLPASALATSGQAMAEVPGVFPLVLARIQTLAFEQRFRALASIALRPSSVPAGGELSEARFEFQGVQTPGRDLRAGPVTPAVFMLLAALAGIALINLAGFLLTLTNGRQRELAARRALGATRARVLRQLLTESLLLGAAGAVTGLFAAKVCVPLLVYLLNLPLGVGVTLDGRTYGFVVMVALVIAGCAGLAAWRYSAEAQMLSQLYSAAGTTTAMPRTVRFRSVMVAVQIAISIVLVMSAALLARAASRSRNADVGFDVDRLLKVSGRAIGVGWTADDADGYWRLAAERVRGVAAIERSAFALHTFGGGFEHRSIRRDVGHYAVAFNRTSADYFDAVGISILLGRGYSARQAETNAPVAMVSRKVARDLWGLENAVGSSLTFVRDPVPLTVIGVVEDVIGTTLLELSDPVGTVYRPLSKESLPHAFLVLRAQGDLRLAGAQVEKVLPSFLKDRPPRVVRMAGALEAQRDLTQVPARIAIVAGLTIVALTAIGLQGLVSLVVRQGVRDLAIRMVLGATPLAIARHAAGRALRPALWAVPVGCAGAVLAARALSTILFGLSPFDAPSLSVAAGVIICALCLGIVGPLRRALRVDPAHILKGD